VAPAPSGRAGTEKRVFSEGNPGRGRFRKPAAGDDAGRILPAGT